MSTSTPNSTDASPVTRIATFRFLPNVTAEQKGDRASAFLALYAEHPELLVEGPKGGRPLNTPLNLTNVKRESVWDLGFVVVFKDEASRQVFDKDPTHDKLKVCVVSIVVEGLKLTSRKNETDPLLEQVFVMAESYLEPLRHLTKNGFDDARLLLLQGLSREQRSALIQEGMKRFTTDEASVQLCLRMLDSLQQPEERAASELPIERNDTQQPSNMQAAPAPALAAHIPPTFGMAPPRHQTKRKATENVDPSNDRAHKAPVLNTTCYGGSSCSNGDEDDDEDWEGMTAKLDNALRDDTPAVANANINVIDRRSTTLAMPVLKIGAWVINAVGLEEWQLLDDVESGKNIYARFLTDFAANQCKRATYKAVAWNVAHYITEGKCAKIAMWQRGCAQMTFEKAFGNKQRACDTCIRTKRLCVRVVADGFGTKLCAYPLPDACLEDKSLHSIAEWVIGG
ncbi:hypothetical protein J4E85_009774 [Alternaria conjuncta]|uniref:uncharacterized protein n=1 Tax=Alternaria conjuncta TaxID=181017 RepID=UPI00222120BA|nr:uncharacterized protein J4E85_009774 [Alternaria conjuncta]KAI4917682.1 hypothetical protein J4E85_009774 [Alternaria conjuncta]